MDLMVALWDAGDSLSADLARQWEQMLEVSGVIQHPSVGGTECDHRWPHCGFLSAESGRTLEFEVCLLGSEGFLKKGWCLHGLEALGTHCS
jgi:hypothetical protein